MIDLIEKKEWCVFFVGDFSILIKDIQSVRIKVKEGIYVRHVLYMDIRGQGAILLTRTDENVTPQKIEQKVAELAYSLRVLIEVF